MVLAWGQYFLLKAVPTNVQSVKILKRGVRTAAWNLPIVCCKIPCHTAKLLNVLAATLRTPIIELALIATIQTTIAEGLCRTALMGLRDQYGIIENVTSHEYLTNSHHVPVWEKVSIPIPCILNCIVLIHKRRRLRRLPYHDFKTLQKPTLCQL